jgi:CRISPR-associated protein Cmr4
MDEIRGSAIYLHALTPIHTGTGQASASVIDLPIAREKATNWPVIPATSLKGVLRAATPEDDRDRLFGTQDSIGDLQIGDARLLCFPVRSWKGVFAYVTCPLALERLRRDFTALGIPVPFSEKIPNVGPDGAAITSKSLLIDGNNSEIWLDDLELKADVSEEAEAIAAGIEAVVFPRPGDGPDFVKRFAIVEDDVFDFLAETATEVTARIKLNQNGTKTVETGGLWYEEAVPAEAIFAAPVLSKTTLSFTSSYIQIGGHESVGRGLCRLGVSPR